HSLYAMAQTKSLLNGPGAMLFIGFSACAEDTCEARRQGTAPADETGPPSLINRRPRLPKKQTMPRMSASQDGVPNPAAAPGAGLDKRGSTRVVQAMPIKVHGVDALSESFAERTSTVMVSCHGCKYQSRHYVPKGSIVTVEIPRRNPNAPARIVAGSVIWVQRPSHARD